MMVNNDVAYCGRLSIWPTLSKDAIRDFSKNLEATVPSIAQFLVRQFGVLHEAVLVVKITDPSLAKSMWDKRKIILETYGSLLRGAFDEYISQVGQAFGHGGPDPQELREKRLVLLKYLPMPYVQTYPIAVRSHGPLQMQAIAVYKKSEQEYIKRLFQDVDGEESDEKEAGGKRMDIEYTQFITSKAGLIQGGAFISWYELLRQYALCNQTNSEKARLVLEDCGCAAYITVKKRLLDPELPKNLSFRGYAVERSTNAVQEHANLKFSPKCRKMVATLFISDDLARRQTVFFTSQKGFENTENPPNDTNADTFMKMLAQFCKFRNSSLEIMAEAAWEELFDWFVEGGAFEPFDFPSQGIEAALGVTAAFCKEAGIPRHVYFHAFRSLSKMQHRDAFIAFLRQAKEDGIPLMQYGVISSLFNPQMDRADYAPLLELVRTVQGALKKYTVCRPPKAQFWVDILALPAEAVEKVAAFAATFTAVMELPETFYHLLCRYLQGKVKNEDFQLLEILPKQMECDFNIDKGTICEVLARVQNKVPYPLDEARIEAVVDILQLVFKKYQFSVREIGNLFFELLTIEPLAAFQQLGLLTSIEEFVGFPLHPNDAYYWLMHSPSPQTASAVLTKFFEQRKAIVERYLDDFALPTPVLTAYHHNAPEMQLLESAGASPGRHVYTEFQQAAASIGGAMTLAMPPNSFQLISDFVHVDAILDRPFECGEESRTQMAMKTLCLLSPKYPKGKAIWRGWEIPQNDEHYPVFTFHIVDLQTMRTYTVRALVELPWQTFTQDETLLDMLHEMSKTMGQENHVHVQELPQGDALDQWLPLFPEFAQKWGPYQPKQADKQLAGAAFFKFVRTIKVSFRRGLIELATNAMPYAPDLLKNPLTGHVYPLQDRLSLLAPNSPITSIGRALYTIGPEYGPLCEKLQNRTREIIEKTYAEFCRGIDQIMQSIFGYDLNGLCSALAKHLSEACDQADESFFTEMPAIIQSTLGNGTFKNFCERVVREAIFLTKRNDEAFSQEVEKIVLNFIGADGENYARFCNALKKTLEQVNGESVRWEDQLPSDCFPKPLRVSLRLFLLSKEKSSALNEVTLSMGELSHTVRYSKIAFAENFHEIVKWHILLLIQKVHQNG